MSTQVWPQVNMLRDGENLDATTLNAPLEQLAERTSFLKSRIADMAAGGVRSSMVLEDVALSDGADAPNVGNVVYMKDSGVFAAAKADMDLYDDFAASNRALVVGILQSKGGNYGSVVVYGQMSLESMMVSNMIESGEEFRPGRYYLSSREAGKLTSSPGGPLVYVGVVSGAPGNPYGMFSDDSFVLVNPQFLDIGTSHVHRTAVLVARPAGAVDENGKVVGYLPNGGAIGESPSLLFGGTWTSDSNLFPYEFSLSVSSVTGVKLCWDGGEAEIEPNGNYVDVSNGLKAKLVVPQGVSPVDGTEWPTLVFPHAGQGWVSHEGDEEPGAKYDYNAGFDAQVSNFWPPVPPKSAAVLVNGVEMDNKALFPDNPTVSFGPRAIHWFQDAQGKTPWPAGVEDRDDPVDPSDDKTMVMHWVKCFQGATGPVTSLQVKSGSPISVYGYGSGSQANTGDLVIAADFDFEVEDGGLPGFNVPKAGRDGKLKAGPVVEKVLAGAGISIITKKGCPRGQGTVTIGLENGAYRSQFGDIALENAEQAKIGMFPYVRLKGYSGATMTPSAFTATMRVPTNLPEDQEYALIVQAAVFGEASFTDSVQRTAGISLDYNILQDYTDDEYRNLKTGLLKPSQSRDVRIDFGHASGTGFAYDAFDPMVVSTEDPDLEEKPGVVSFAFGKAIPDIADFGGQAIADVSLKPGYLVGLKFSRTVPALQSGEVAYTGAMGFINLLWNLVSIG